MTIKKSEVVPLVVVVDQVVEETVQETTIIITSRHIIDVPRVVDAQTTITHRQVVVDIVDIHHLRPPMSHNRPSHSVVDVVIDLDLDHLSTLLTIMLILVVSRSNDAKTLTRRDSALWPRCVPTITAK